MAGRSKSASNLNLTQKDVDGLVLEYLAAKGFAETESVLKRELKGNSKKAGSPVQTENLTRLEDLLEKSFVTDLVSGDMLPKKRARSHLDAVLKPVESDSDDKDADMETEGDGEKKVLDMDTQLVNFNPMGEKDPYGASVMPLYQTSTFMQPAADKFGDYDYTRSGNPTRDQLQLQCANLENSPGARAFAFTTGMAAITAVSHLVKSGEEVIVNDDSYGGTYRLMSKVAAKQPRWSTNSQRS